MKSVIRWPTIGLLFLLLGFAAASVAAQSALPAKPYQQWTMKEVENVLRDSPWAQLREKGVYLDTQQANASDAVILRLRSALPVREALARLRQLKANYDKLNDKDKKAVDEKAKILIDCPACVDNYVVALGPGTGQTKGVPTILQTMSQAEAKLNVHLTNELGETRELVHFAAPKFQGDEAVFFFARFDSKGQPLITAKTKKVLVVFDQKIFNMSSFPIIKFEFDVAKMLVNGEVAF